MNRNHQSKRNIKLKQQSKWSTKQNAGDIINNQNSDGNG